MNVRDRPDNDSVTRIFDNTGNSDHVAVYQPIANASNLIVHRIWSPRNLIHRTATGYLTTVRLVDRNEILGYAATRLAAVDVPARGLCVACGVGGGSGARGVGGGTGSVRSVRSVCRVAGGACGLRPTIVSNDIADQTRPMGAREPHRSRSAHGRRKWSITMSEWQVQMQICDSHIAVKARKGYTTKICVTRRLELLFPDSCSEHGVIVNSRPRSPVVSPSEPERARSGASRGG
jgi:hypothetical protein